MAPTLELNPKLSIVETTVAISHDLIRNEQLHLGLLALSETCLKTVQCLSADTHGEPRKLLGSPCSSGRSVAGRGLVTIYRSTDIRRQCPPSIIQQRQTGQMCKTVHILMWGPAGTTGQRILVYDHCDYLSKSISNGRFLWRPCHTHIICVQVGERLLLCGDLIIYLALKVIIINDMLTDTSRTAFTAMICMDLHLSKESCWKIVS